MYKNYGVVGLVMRFSYLGGSASPSLFIVPLAVWMTKASLMILLL